MSKRSKGGDSVTVCYEWGADGISWFDGATGTSRVTLPITMTEFLRRVAKIHRGELWASRRPIEKRFSIEQRRTIATRARQMRKDGKTYNDVAAEFDISRAYASLLARGLAK